MTFQIPDTGGSYLPKDVSKKIVNLAVEKSLVLKLISQRGNVIDALNEKTIPVLASADDSKIFYTNDTADLDTLDEASIGMKGALLAPKELGGRFFLSDKDIRRFKVVGNLDDIVQGKIADSLARVLEKIALVGDTTKTGTDPLRVADGMYTIANSSLLRATTPVTFSDENTQGIVNAVVDAKAALTPYSDNNDNLIIFAGKTFYANAKKNASTLVVGFDLLDYAPLGLKRIVFVDGTPVIQRSNISDKDAVLVDIRGGYVAYETQIKIEPIRRPNKRGYDNYLTVYTDYKWAYVNGSDKNEGLILIQDIAS